jgi:hypothetical protein
LGNASVHLHEGQPPAQSALDDLHMKDGGQLLEPAGPLVIKDQQERQ